MNIAVIGSGNVGKALAGSSVRAGHKVTISSAHPEKAAEAASAVGATAAKSGADAVKGAEVVILAVPASAADQVVRGLGSALDGKVVVDVINRINNEEPSKVLDGSSMSEHIQGLAPKAHVVKAFNHMFATRMADPAVDGIHIDAFVAGDDEAARAKVLELARSIGFRPIDAGPLVMARALEGMGSLIVSLQIRHGWPWQNGWKLVGPPA